jgi:probable rRNA maturation factor
MTTSLELPACGDEAGDGEGDPSRTSTDISIQDRRWIAVPGLTDLIPRLVSEALDRVSLAPECHIVSIALLSDEAVGALNGTYRGKESATNVLSFPSPSTRAFAAQIDAPIFLGDVALAFETVEREALSQKKPLLHHAANLVVHGVLHLAGFDHEDDASADRMEAEERAILERFGIPDPCANDACSIDH